MLPLSPSSVYVAPASGLSGEKQLYCAKDVPKTVHANVVDSLALRAALSTLITVLEARRGSAHSRQMPQTQPPRLQVCLARRKARPGRSASKA